MKKPTVPFGRVGFLFKSGKSVLGLVYQLVLGNPGHHGAQL
jgi:hypothetical protein